MAMTPNGMASAIISSISGSTDAYDANNKFIKLCVIMEGNAQVFMVGCIGILRYPRSTSYYRSKNKNYWITKSKWRYYM